MNSMRTRAKDAFPAVLMTLLSIIQALALEFLWGYIRDNDYLWALDWPALLAWLQIVAAMLGIVQVWLFFTSVAMRFRWTPNVRDLLLPFLIGVLEFTFIDLIGAPNLSWWLVALAMVYGLSMWVSQDIFVRARRDPDNEEFFGVVEPATVANLIGPVATVSVLLIFAAAVRVVGAGHWLALAATLFAIVSLLHRVEQGRRYWNRSMGIG
jgi:hypothetical protein